MLRFFAVAKPERRLGVAIRSFSFGADAQFGEMFLPVKGEFFGVGFGYWRNDKGRKSGESVAYCRIVLCKLLCIKKLYFKAVEKSVDNVEKCELSTVFSGFSTWFFLAYFSHIFPRKWEKTVAFLRYVAMGNSGVFPSFSVKKLSFSINKAQSGSSLVGIAWKYLLKLHKKSRGMIFRLPEILKEKTGGRQCREK